MNSLGDTEADIVVAKRVHPIVYVLLVNKFATLKELRDDYTIWEVLDMYETCMVQLHNKAEMMKAGVKHG